MAGLARAAAVAASLAAFVAAAPAGAATNNIFTQVGNAGPGAGGDGGPASAAQVNTPTGIEMMPDGGYLIADQFNKRVRRVAPDGTITSLPSTGFSTAINGVAILPDGGVLVADSNGNVVRKIKDGVVTTVAGTGGAGYNGEDITATTAQLNFPTGVATRSNGTWLIADQDNNRVREVGLDGKIRTVAGTGGFGSTGNGGPATSAPVVGPADIALTSDGGFLVAEFDTNRVRKVSSTGIITRVAGTGVAGGTGDGGPAIDAKLAAPVGIAVRAGGGFIVSEHAGHRLRAVGPDGVITRVAGTGTAGYNGDNQPATDARLNTPTGVAVNGEGDYLIADALNSRIRRIDAGDPPKPPDPPGPPPAPPPAPPPKEHTLLGQITYEPPYGIGFQGLDGLGPFDTRDVPPSVTVRLRDAGGAELAKSSYSRSDSGFGVLRIRGPVLYRLDGLGSCEPCTLELSAGDVVQDTRTVSFSGEAGQTEENLVFGRATEGGVVKGAVNVPYGARTRDLNVVILGADGKVLADGSRTQSCGEGSGFGCGTGPSSDYRLTGLPRDAVPVKVVLRQFTAGGKRVDADSADVVLDASGTTIAPPLTAIPDLPAGIFKSGRRTLYGQINYRAPFAPGARRAGDLDVEPKDLRRLNVELRNSNGKLIRSDERFRKTALGYTGYELGDLNPCENCTVSLIEDRKVVSSAPVTVPAESPSLVRRDFNYAKAGKPEFLAGGVLIGDAGAKGLTVVVTDAASGEKLAGTDEGQQACASGTRCPSKETLLYRIAGVPPDRDVILTLQRKGTPVDTQRVHTAAADEITQAPLLVLPRGKGPRSIQGVVLNAGPFPPGEEARDPTTSTVLAARLVATDGTELKRGTARLVADDARIGSASYFLDNLPECMGCTLELLRPDGVVDDRAVVDVRADSPSVTVSDLRWQAISGGSYVDGQVVVRKGAIAASDLVVQVIGADGKVLADSIKVRGKSKSASGATGRARGPFTYRLGGIPLDASKVKVVVFERGRKKSLASTTVTLAVGGADTKVPDLKVDLDARKG